MESTYHVCNFLFRTALKLFASLQVYGIENVPQSGPLIVVANHQSFVDPVLLGTVLPRRLRFLGKRSYFKGPIIRTILANYGAYPLNGSGKDLVALHWTFLQLEMDRTVVIFPEGTRNPGRMKYVASPGVATIALKSQAPILPVGITGTERMGPIWRYVLPTGEISVTIGQPFSLPVMTGKIGRQELVRSTDIIMAQIAGLLPPSYQGAYRTTSG